jgi:hypothetical protein
MSHNLNEIYRLFRHKETSLLNDNRLNWLRSRRENASKNKPLFEPPFPVLVEGREDLWGDKISTFYSEWMSVRPFSFWLYLLGTCKNGYLWAKLQEIDR